MYNYSDHPKYAKEDNQQLKMDVFFIKGVNHGTLRINSERILCDHSCAFSCFGKKLMPLATSRFFLPCTILLFN